LRREELEIIINLEIITKEPLKTNLQELEQIRNIPTYKNKINSILEEARTLAAEKRSQYSENQQLF
ncbi:23659_t:CDS:1, partial [Racocetra persica]